MHLVGDGISLIVEGLHILSARSGESGEQNKADSQLRESLRQLVLSQLMTPPSPTSEPEVSGRGPNVCESKTPPATYAPPAPLQTPVAGQRTGFVSDYKPGPRPYLHPNLPEPEGGPQQEPPALPIDNSSPPQREITSSPFERIRIKLRQQQAAEAAEAAKAAKAATRD